MLKRPLLGVLTLALLMMLQTARLAAAPIISAGTPIPQSTDTFVVPIEISDAVELINWQFDLAFDPAVVQIYEGCDPFLDSFCDLFTGPVTEGPFTEGPFSLFVPGVIDNATGLLSIVAGAWQDPPPGPSGDGTLAYVLFLTLDPQGDPNIRVTDSSVTSSAVPEPHAMLLMAGGLMMLGAQRVAKHLRAGKV